MTTEEHTAAAAEPPFAKYPSPLLEWHAHVVITRSFKGSAPSLPLLPSSPSPRHGRRHCCATLWLDQARSGGRSSPSTFTQKLRQVVEIEHGTALRRRGLLFSSPALPRINRDDNDADQFIGSGGGA